MSMSGARATATNHTPGRETPARPERNPARPPPTTHHQKEGPWPDHHPHNTLRGERPRRGGGETPQDHPPHHHHVAGGKRRNAPPAGAVAEGWGVHTRSSIR